MFDYFLKTIVIGDSGVGKTRIIANNSQQIEPTIGIDLVTDNVIWNHKTIKMHVWDTSGNLNYLNLVKTYLAGCIGAFIVCNLNDQKSVNSVEDWIRLYLDYRKTYGSIVIVGNIFKNDYNVNYQLIDELCKKYNAYYIELDAKKSGMITVILKKMSEIIIEYYKMNPHLFRNIEGFRDEMKIKNNGDYSIESGENYEIKNTKYCCSICSIM